MLLTLRQSPDPPDGFILRLQRQEGDGPFVIPILTNWSVSAAGSSVLADAGHGLLQPMAAEFRQQLRTIERNFALEPRIRPCLPDVYRKLRNAEFARPATEPEARINHQRTANDQQTIRRVKQGEGTSDSLRRHRVTVEDDIGFNNTPASDTLGNPKFADTGTVR